MSSQAAGSGNKGEGSKVMEVMEAYLVGFQKLGRPNGIKFPDIG